MGYRRANGGVGTRNHIGVLSSVNCSATVAKHIAESVKRSGILETYLPRTGKMAAAGSASANKNEIRPKLDSPTIWSWTVRLRSHAPRVNPLI